MDETDRKLLNVIQSEFPITPKPYETIARRLQLDEEDILARVKRLKKKGVIRRIGANLDSEKLQFTSTLCAANVPEEKIKAFVKKINSYPGITHNYLRKGRYNVWFTFIAQDRETIAKALSDIKEKTQVSDILNLPAIKKFKIKVEFEL